MNPRCWDYLTVSDLSVSQSTLVLVLVLLLWFQFVVVFGKKKKSPTLVQKIKYSNKLCNFQIHALIKCLVVTYLLKA